MPDILWMFALMLFMHVIEDFHVQGILADLKQKRWWTENVKTKGFDHRYDRDYTVGLLAHGFEWSFFVHIPLIYFIGFDPILLISLSVNAILHSWIDHLKCNLYATNLIEDQAMHIVQIVGITLIVWGLM